MRPEQHEAAERCVEALRKANAVLNGLIGYGRVHALTTECLRAYDAAGEVWSIDHDHANRVVGAGGVIWCFSRGEERSPALAARICALLNADEKARR